VHDVFTRIRSGATVVVFRRRRAWIYTLVNGGSAHWRWFLARSARNGCKCVGWKTLRVSAYIYKSIAASPTAGWISLQTADSAVAPDSSTFTSRRSSSRGLGYFYSTSWVATRLKSNSGAKGPRSLHSSRCLVAGVSAELWKWHRRLGHLSFDLLSRLSGLALV
jgi:hypothetical protein